MLLSDEELEMLHFLAEYDGLTASDYLRSLIRRECTCGGLFSLEERRRYAKTGARDLQLLVEAKRAKLRKKR
jgi:hypothetical protein